MHESDVDTRIVLGLKLLSLAQAQAVKTVGQISLLITGNRQLGIF